MPYKHISQAEAHRLKRELAALKERNRIRMNTFRRSYPGGVHARTFRMNDASKTALRLAEKLGCALVAKTCNDSLDIYAVPQE